MTMMQDIPRPEVPGWVPVPVRHYLAHTVSGTSIRALARQCDVHPSTIMRQVRACELRRDDPLIDAALRALSPVSPSHPSKESRAMPHAAPARHAVSRTPVTQGRLDREALHILRRLCEPRAVMAVARDMDSAVIVREDPAGGTLRTAVVESDIAQAMALQNWISCADPEARIARYHITGQGRTALRQLTAADENRANGFAETAQDTMDGAAFGNVLTARFIAAETPLMGLSRRRDRDGKPFLCKELVKAGERLREDFVLSRPGPDAADDWRDALNRPGPGTSHPGVQAARARVIAALDDLGPGLQDAVLRCCCLLEGLETTEQRLGWSARSGKIVLRISLQRLSRHYEEATGKFGPRIG
ncbi:hypothetical protein SAMN05444339_101443 [Loktanella atrilutea]|uniref:DUF6456 domain-containing protein n=2 Tax=Loktanella atrilutea TaxID=366533 RepID=A0A1M4TPX8_LOKAT|nr:DUF6456 domain-containing protein [Loktanella atrilutea]SHE46559.1 hypothetical protein SAMN05444339_101443 [Loktanella atrilutea]